MSTALAAAAPAVSGPHLAFVSRSAHFEIIANVDPHISLRMLNYFAQRDLVPSVFRSRRVREKLEMRVVVPGLSEHDASVIADKMRGQFAVAAVTLEMVVGA